MERITQICRCMNELESARRDYKSNPLGAQLSELDWLHELHILLHG